MVNGISKKVHFSAMSVVVQRGSNEKLKMCNSLYRYFLENESQLFHKIEKQIVTMTWISARQSSEKSEFNKKQKKKFSK